MTINFSQLVSNAGFVERYMNGGETPLRKLNPRELKAKLERLPDLTEVYFIHRLRMETYPETEVERLDQSK